MKRLIKGTSLIFALAGLLLMGSFLTGCDEDDNNNNGNNDKVSIVARGGDADTGMGGQGGQVLAQAVFPGANLDVQPGGEVGVKFLNPGSSSLFFGPEPWVVGRDTTVMVYLDTTDADNNAEIGEHLTLLDDDNLYRKDGNGDYAVISGLKVMDGVVLTLGLNIDDAGQSGEELAALSFSDDVAIDGVVKPMSLDTGDLNGTVELRDGAPATDRDMGALYIECVNFSLRGRIDTAGKDATVGGDRGGFGGAVTLSVFGEIRLGGRIDLSGGNGRLGGDGGDAGWNATSLSGLQVVSNVGDVVNRAAIEAGGGSGDEGGEAGVVVVQAMGDVINFGAVRADGGKAMNGDAGDALALVLVSATNSVHNRGKVSLRGGDAVEDGVGGPVMAGDGGQVQLIGSIDISNTGDIDLSGGDASVDGIGGNSGTLTAQVSMPAGSVINRARISAMGGESQGVGYPGGNGGVVALVAGSGSARVKGRIDVSGGSGDIGGTGGQVQVIGGSEASLRGFDSGLKVDGGDGAMGGGGGQVILGAPSGSLTNHVFVSGDAGRSDISAGPPAGVYQATAFFLDHQGRVSLQGSNAADGNGGPGGQVFANTLYDLIFQGDVLIQGGNASGAGNYNGGPGGGVNLQGGNVNVRGGANGSGGRAVGTGTGGTGGVVTITANEHVKSKAYCLVGGGDGDNTIGFGGPGGVIVLDSDLATPTSHHGRFDATGGAGNVAGPDGNVTVDGVVVWP